MPDHPSHKSHRSHPSHSIRLLLGDCLAILPTLPTDSIDAILQDPPYGIGFMGKKWDTFNADRLALVKRELTPPRLPGRKTLSPSGFGGRSGAAGSYDFSLPGQSRFYSWCLSWAAELLRVAKPGAHMLCFGGPRTFHRLACAIEDAGWEIRDTLGWLYGQGFPKSLDVSKAIDKEAGSSRRVVGMLASHRPNPHSDTKYSGNLHTNGRITEPSTAAAAEWDGWGTALKPAWEPILLCRKPLSEPTVAANVLRWGTGALNIDACRIALEEKCGTYSTPGTRGRGRNVFSEGFPSGARPAVPADGSVRHDARGRWPANVLHDGSPDALAVFPAEGKPSIRASDRAHQSPNAVYGAFATRGEGWSDVGRGFSDSGSAGRFFYCPKASKSDREEGCEGVPATLGGTMDGGHVVSEDRTAPKTGRVLAHNSHPTVKPTALLRYLCRLITPPGGTVLDPFMGSGSTGKAALLEGFRFLGIDREREYLRIAVARVRWALAHPIAGTPHIGPPGRETAPQPRPRPAPGRTTGRTPQTPLKRRSKGNQSATKPASAGTGESLSD